jgi:serine/threonine-protein kinase RsbW
MSKDLVSLTVPVRGEYARTVRMTAAELASRIGMSYDEVDDVRMATEEAFVYAGRCSGATGTVTFAFQVDEGELSVAVGPLASCCTPDAETAVSESYAEFILASVCDEFSVDHTEGQCMLRFVRRVGATSENAGA